MMRKSLSLRETKDSRGQILILMAYMMMVLAMSTALVIDLGLVIRDRTAGQAAADAAALAGATALAAGDTGSAAEQVATTYVALNNFDRAGDGMLVESPPTSGPYAANPACISVFVSRTRSAVFSSVAGFDLLDSDAVAVACTEPGLADYAIIALNETDCDTIALNGTVTIDVDVAGIWSNSSCSVKSLYANGTVDITAKAIDVVGGCEVSSNASLTPSCTHPYLPISDPLGSLPVPTPPTDPPDNVYTCPDKGTQALLPGIYNCAINAEAGSNYTFEAGNYLVTGGIRLAGGVSATFKGGEFTLQGSGLTVTATANMTSNETMFYIDQGSLTLDGSADLELMAPTSGDYEGVLFFQNRSNTNDITITGGAAGNNLGIVYAVGATVVYSGTASTSFQFVVDKFTTGGTTDTAILFEGIPIADAPDGVRLVV